VFQHPDTLWSGMLRSRHQHENRGRMRVRARSGAAPAKHELPVTMKRVESVVREIHRGILRFGSHFTWCQCQSPPRATARIVTGSEPPRAQRRRGQRRQVRTPVSAYSQDIRFPPGAPQQTAHAVALASLLPFDVDVDHLLPVLDAQVVEGEKLA
jgi:hypothetical protein